jgi:hypothetical protein
MFDMDLENLKFDGNMNWGIPLINAGYNMEEILKTFGEMGYINYDSNGDYFFEYTSRKEEHFAASKYIQLQNSTSLFSLSLLAGELSHRFDNNMINISNEDIKIISTIVKSGDIKLDVSDVSASGIDYEILIESKTIFNKDHTPFAVNLSKDYPVRNVPAAGLIVETEDGNLVFDITITNIGTPSANNFIFKPQISLSNISFKEIEVELLKELTHSYTTADSFSVFPPNIGINAIIHNPILSFNITNTFGASANITVAKAFLKSSYNEQSILIENDSKFNVPQNYSGFIQVPNTKSEILLSSNFDSLIYKYTVNIPKGKIKIFDNSVVFSTITFNVFFDVTVNLATFTDTIPFGLAGLSGLSILDTVKMRTAFINSIPVDFKAQILFYNSKTQTVTDSLLSKPLTIKGSYSGASVPSEVQFFNITNNRIKKLQQADQMILAVSLNTEGQHKTFNRNNALHLKLGAQILIVPK